MGKKHIKKLNTVPITCLFEGRSSFQASSETISHLEGSSGVEEHTTTTTEKEVDAPLSTTPSVLSLTMTKSSYSTSQEASSIM